MNYYEELGVSLTASEEEIRQAFRCLAKIVHPDHHSDPRFRELGELQMKRITEIRSVLLNQKRREEYDHALRELTTPQTGWSFASSLYKPVVLCAGAGAVVSLLLWFLPTSGGPVPQSVIATRQEAAVSEKSTIRSKLPKRPRITPHVNAREETASRIPTTQDAEVQSPPVLLPAEDSALTAELPEPVAGVTAFPIRAPAPLEQPSFPGRWYYVTPRHPQRVEGVYRPEYVELRVAESSGVLRGRYDARYSVSDRAISPLVHFQFEGRPEANRMESVPWTGTGGAQGKVNLRLLSPDRLHVSWSVEQPSAELNLSEGTSVLVRYREQ
jgi:hypothetical protein